MRINAALEVVLEKFREALPSAASCSAKCTKFVLRRGSAKDYAPDSAGVSHDSP